MTTNSDPISAAYAAASLFSTRMNPEIVYPLLKALGDVALIERMGSCFGKQKYSEFMDAAKVAAFDPKQRLTKGYDPSRVPADDAFTVLDLLRILSEDDGNKVLLDHPEFKYNRIGRGRVDASENLSAEEQAEVEKLTVEMTKTRDAKKIKDLADKIAAITANKQAAALKFVEDKDVAAEGYSINNLTYNEKRPNISILIRKTGTVDLSSRLKDGEHPKVPRQFPTFVFRNYAIVKDGLVNVAKLPVRVTKVTWDKIKDHVGIAFPARKDVPVNGGDGSQEVVIDLASLPIINRKMVKACSAKTLFEMEWQLTKLQAAQKVYNTTMKDSFPKKVDSFEVLYGPDAAKWLQEQGFGFNGFAPKTIQAEAQDFYMGKELVISIKGFSSIPSVNDYRKQASKGKFTPSASIMTPAIQEVEAFLASDVYKKAKDGDKLYKAWLEGQTKSAQAEVRKLICEMAKIKFGISVGQVWFTEFKSIDENSLEITVDGQKLACKVEAKEVKVEI